MEQDTEYMILPLEERCAHKSWRVRLHRYEECVKTFQSIDDEKSPEWNKYIGFIKKFVVDSNAAAQKKGLEATLAFVENAAIAGKIVNEVMNGIVSKCIAAPKAKTKELAVQITLMYIEIEKHEAVQQELLKGTEAKNPKIVSACIATLMLALKEFGSEVINLKPLIKKIASFLEDRDKTVREEGKAMVVEMYRWVGDRLKQQLNTLKPVHITELEAEFSNLADEKVVPTRYLRSQKPKNMGNNGDSAAASDNGEDDNEDADGASIPDIDPYDLLSPVDILSKLPKDFYEKVEAKKWQERKEALEALETLVKNPKLENGDYGDVVRALKKIISKDTNVLVVTLAGKCLAYLAAGLKKRFQPYATACLPTILEKFREKKQSVVQALREAADAIYQSISIDLILEDTLAALENKNPAVKAETAAYLARCFAHTPPANLNKKLLKSYTGALLKTLNEPDPTVRDNSAEALGTAMKLIGEKAMMPFLTDIDNLKMTKIKECADKAVIVVKVTSGTKKQERPNTAPAKVESQRANKASKENSKSGKSSAARRPNTAAGKKAATKKAGGSSSLTNLATSKKAVQMEKNYSPEEIEEMAAQFLPAEVITGLGDGNWKTRLAAVTQLSDTVKTMDTAEVSAQVIVRTLAKKPGFKDTNFQVLKLRVEIVKYLAENHPFTATVAEYCLMDIAEKLADAKNSSIAADTLLAIAEAMSFEYVADEVVAFAFNQKNPKVQQETLLWLCRGLTEFGCGLNIKSMLENIKKAVAATNPSVRTAAITLLGTLYLYMGKPLLAFFDNEKPALRQQIEQECEKRNGEIPPASIRGAKSKKTNAISAEDEEEDMDESAEKKAGSEQDLNELIPHVDINAQITEALLTELADKNWKVRNEALQKVNTMLSEAKFIKSTIGDLPQGLALRLVDSNSKIAQAALGICETLATAIGPPVKQHVRALFPGFLSCLGDSKNWIRAAAISCINTWGDQCGYKEFFDGEMIGDALKTGSPTLRSELWNWLAQKLPLIPVKQISKEELFVCLPYLYANLEDRNSDVRKNAQEAVLGYMIHLSYEAMVRQTEKLKPGSRTGVIAALDKARPSLPIKPLPKKELSDDNIQKGAKGAKVVKVVKSKGASSKPGSARKKDDDVDTSPLLVVNNLKHQRVIDEQKLKVLKWNFTTPREEFVELLKDLMTAANVNKTLRANMFHSDFRYHLKAIEALTEDLSGNNKALVSNLDLILKWLTLRFFDTNPSVLLKGLDYLQLVFNMLIEDQYHMLETEAASFIPYLIIKIGDPKDAVRNGVRALFKQMALVYPVSKLFSYVMEGLKSKNARQRTECLDQLGSLIENYGVSVCQPNPSVALKEIAKQIADRDNSVRNAALNCIVQAYFLQGERVFKLIGQISEKDRSLLDERIKRAAKNRPTKSASATRLSTPAVATSSPPTDDMEADYEEEQEEIAEPMETVPELACATSTTDNNEDDQVSSVVKTESPSKSDQEIVSETNTQNHLSDRDGLKTNSPTSLQAKVPSGPFGLDMDFLQRLELSAPVKYRNPILVEPSLSDLNEPPANVLNPPKTQMIPISPPKLLVSKSSSVVSPVSTASSKDDTLERNILSMASMDLPTAIQSMNAIENLLKSHQAVTLQSKEDKFIGSVNMQLKLLQTYPLRQENADVSRGFRNTFLVILVFYDSGFLGKNVPFIQLKELVDQMISLLAENKLEHLHQAAAYYRVINNIMVKIIDNSNHTTIICVLIKLLHSCAESNVPSKYEELVMKCLWKIVKTMSNWAADLDYDTILLEVHRFLKDYPTTWWKKRKSDTPLRTIKTVLHSMTRVKGSSILNHLTLINNTNESELQAYLIRLIASLKPDEINATAKVTPKSNNVGRAPKHLSKSTRQQLAEIFKKIGSKEHMQEGLVQLYDFKVQYPEADVQPFLVKSHQFFQDFIEQGLREIDQARKNQTILSHNQYSMETTESSAVVADEKDMMDPMYRLEKLRALEAQCRVTSQPNPP